VQHEATDRVGGAARVVEELRVGRIAFLHHVLLEGVDEIAQKRRGQRVRAHGAGDAREPGFGLAARLDRVERAQVSIEPRQALGGARVALVGDVVGAPREAVDGLDGRSQAGRKQPRRDREILVVVDRQGGRKRLNFLDYIGRRAPVRADRERPFSVIIP
jgi:hypothetical protein